MADENIFFGYLVQKINEEMAEYNTKPQKHPFVTISRQHGCNAKEIAEILITKFNKHGRHSHVKPQWKSISKEILEAASNDLNVQVNRVQQVYSQERLNAIHELIVSFSKKHYKSEGWVLNSIANVIRGFAEEGNAVIIGRGSAAIACNLQFGFHVRLEAPFEWRAAQLKKHEHLKSIQQARDSIKKIDKKRSDFIRKISKKNYSSSDFHLTYNCMYFTPEQIADSIIHHMEMKGFIKHLNPPFDHII